MAKTGYIDLRTNALTIDEQFEGQIPDHFSLSVNTMRRQNGSAYLHDTFQYPETWRKIYLRLLEAADTDKDLKLKITRAGCADNNIQYPFNPRDRKDCQRSWHLSFETFPAGTRTIRLLLQFANNKEDFDDDKCKDKMYAFSMLIVPRSSSRSNGVSWQKNGDLYWTHDPQDHGSDFPLERDTDAKFRLWSYGENEHSVATMTPQQLSNHRFFKYKFLGPYANAGGTGNVIDNISLASELRGDIGTLIGNDGIKDLTYTIKTTAQEEPTQGFIKLVRMKNKDNAPVEGTVVIQTPRYTSAPPASIPAPSSKRVPASKPPPASKQTPARWRDAGLEVTISGSHEIKVNLKRIDISNQQPVTGKLVEYTHGSRGQELATDVAYFEGDKPSAELTFRFNKLPLDSCNYMIELVRGNAQRKQEVNARVSWWQSWCFAGQQLSSYIHIRSEAPIVPVMGSDVVKSIIDHVILIVLTILGGAMILFISLYSKGASNALVDRAKEHVNRQLDNRK
ncbi:MAG: hypothetical protein KC777_22850 [Cyanobacteria bacterium HKST-UBA02]|nr:hypothetical protein [Cyanobacteria bacterium HKST-UBA02]